MNDFDFKRFKEFVAEFSYNGDLGRLQHITKERLQIIDDLAMYRVLTFEQFRELKTLILNYFKNQIDKVKDNPTYYL